MSDSEAFQSLKPAKLSERRALQRIALFLFTIAVVAVALLYNSHRIAMKRAQDWTTAVATIEDTRTELVGRTESARGGVMLYEVQVLVRYKAEGDTREQWTPVWQSPKPLADAQLQAFLLKNKQCSVRWRPDDSSHIVAEIN